MKLCKKCGIEKPAAEFGKNAGKRDGLQPWCKQCKAVHHAAYYRAGNHERWRRNDAAWEARRVELINDAKRVPCMDCGGSFPSECMDFDHVRGDKLYNVATMKSRGSRAMLLAEIDKCEVVCANCHRTRTKARLRTQLV